MLQKQRTDHTSDTLGNCVRDKTTQSAFKGAKQRRQRRFCSSVKTNSEWLGKQKINKDGGESFLHGRPNNCRQKNVN